MKLILFISMLMCSCFCNGQQYKDANSFESQIKIIDKMDSLLVVIDKIQDTILSLQLKALEYWSRWDETGFTYYHKIYEKYLDESNEKIEQANVLIKVVNKLRSEIKMYP